MSRSNMWGVLATLGVVALLPIGASLAQNYPERPVTIVVPLAAGSGMDALVRAYGEKLAEGLASRSWWRTSRAPR